eukprot:COSAG01_NODE_41812_length_447_cov_0.577586_1_plen_25_part_01
MTRTEAVTEIHLYGSAQFMLGSYV